MNNSLIFCTFSEILKLYVKYKNGRIFTNIDLNCSKKGAWQNFAEIFSDKGTYVHNILKYAREKRKISLMTTKCYHLQKNRHLFLSCQPIYIEIADFQKTLPNPAVQFS